MTFIVKGLRNLNPTPSIVDFESTSGELYDLHTDHEIVSISFSAGASGMILEIKFAPIVKESHKFVVIRFTGVDLESIEWQAAAEAVNLTLFGNLQFYELDDEAHFIVETGLLDITFQCHEIYFQAI